MESQSESKDQMIYIRCVSSTFEPSMKLTYFAQIVPSRLSSTLALTQFDKAPPGPLPFGQPSKGLILSLILTSTYSLVH